MTFSKIGSSYYDSNRKAFILVLSERVPVRRIMVSEEAVTRYNGSILQAARREGIFVA